VGHTRTQSYHIGYVYATDSGFKNKSCWGAKSSSNICLVTEQHISNYPAYFAV